MNFAAVLGYVWDTPGYQAYADEHRLALNEPHTARRRACHDYMRDCLRASGLGFRRKPVGLGPRLRDGIATCVWIGSNQSSEWKECVKNGKSLELIAKTKEALGRTDEPKWYNVADI